MPERTATYCEPSPTTFPTPAMTRYGIIAAVGRVSPTVKAAIGSASSKPMSITPASVGRAPIIRDARLDARMVALKQAAARNPPMIAVRRVAPVAACARAGYGPRAE